MSSANSSLEISLGKTLFSSPLFAASGVWPLEPELWPSQALEGLGGICSKGITLLPREGNPGVRLAETPSGLLNSIGLQNPGMAAFVETSLPRMVREPLPLVVNVAPQSEEDFEGLFEPLRAWESRIAAVELNLSCPNVKAGGMSWGKDPDGVALATRLARSLWKGALWIKLTPQAPDLCAVARGAEYSGADALVVGNTWLGMAMDLQKKRPVFERVVAGLSGPAIFPLALQTVWSVAGTVDIPVIGCGGVQSWEHAAAMILAGARAVQVGSGLLHSLSLPGEIASGLREYMVREKFGSLAEMTGAGRK
ncbi:MAG TPA: dihydroorotate dehydrogenase [Synergistaceae bacterium]|nr:dihydroorotate dehydrogenase [Synergistaceae bacterium]HPQ37573.1 dihydroorotate dehydrogenase [Synergistaceae bacterium]